MKTIPIARSYFDSAEEKRISAVIRSGWIAQGRMVGEFEKSVAEYTGARYAVAVSSGTAALHLALLVSGIRQGDEVIVPSFSFIATANAVTYCGARPIFADIDLATYNIDAEEIEKIVKRSGGKVKAIMPVHQFGLPCDIDAISEIAKRCGLFLIEDAACALGALYKGRKIGRNSDIACFSFHPRKILTTGEGGMIVTNNREYAEKARALRNHGMSAKAKEEYSVIGYNYRLTDLQAAVGISQMARLEEVLKNRRSLAERYDKIFVNEKFIQVPSIPPYAGHNYQSYVIMMKEGCPVSRDNVLSGLLEHGISARRGNTAIHLQPIYKTRSTRLPNTEKAASSTIALPLYFRMKKAEQDFVADKLIAIVRGKR